MSKQHQLILDPVTASKFPPHIFESFPKPVSAAFNSPIRPSQRAAKHFNPNEAVILSQNKPLAFKLLDSRPEFYAPDFAPMSDFYEGENFDYQEFEDWIESAGGNPDQYSVINRRPTAANVLEGYGDVVKLNAGMKNNPNLQELIQNSIFMTSLQEYHSASVTVAPMFNGIRLTGDKGVVIENGILFEDYHGVTTHITELRMAAMSIAVEFGADYITVEFQYNETVIQVVDVHTRLQPQTIDALRSIFNHMMNA